MARIFIGLKASPRIISLVLDWQENKKDWPVKWIKSTNLHLTLIPPWDGQVTPSLINKLAEINFELRTISFNYQLICVGPQPNQARLIWARGQSSIYLEKLKQKIENSLGRQREDRGFLPHLTLARFKKEAWPKLATGRCQEKIIWPETVNSFSLFESILKPQGAEYQVIKEFFL